MSTIAHVKLRMSEWHTVQISLSRGWKLRLLCNEDLLSSFLFFVSVMCLIRCGFHFFSIIDRLDGVRLLWSLLKSNNPKVCKVVFMSSLTGRVLSPVDY